MVVVLDRCRKINMHMIDHSVIHSYSIALTLYSTPGPVGLVRGLLASEEGCGGAGVGISLRTKLYQLSNNLI